MKKLYATLLMAMMAIGASAQEANDTTYVMMDFTQNIWNYPIREITKGWTPDYTDWDSSGAILEDTDFSWPVSEGSSEKVKVTVYAVDLDEYEKVSVYAKYELNDAEAAALGIEAGMTNMLYTQSGTTMRFEVPAGYKFGKMVFYTYRNSNILVGDEYMEEFEYEYKSSVFKQKLPVWTPSSPHKNQYDLQIWDGDDKNILFNYPFFSVVFVKVDIRLVPDGSANIHETNSQQLNANSPLYDLQGRKLTETPRKGIFISEGKKKIVK
jgi:hypothetical protein